MLHKLYRLYNIVHLARLDIVQLCVCRISSMLVNIKLDIHPIGDQRTLSSKHQRLIHLFH